MELLPMEIVERIISYSDIGMQDVLSLSYSCKYYNNIIQNSNRVWKGIYYKQMSYNFSLRGIKPQMDYKALVENLFEMRTSVGRALDIIMMLNYRENCLDECVRNFWQHFDTVYHYEDVLHYLRAIYHRGHQKIWTDPITKKEYGKGAENFTLEYYVSDLIMYQNEQVVIKELQDYINLPDKQQILEVAATLVAKWCQPELKVSYKEICAKLDRMAKQCEDLLRILHPDHPYFDVDVETLDIWKKEKLESQCYKLDRRMEMIGVVNKVVFETNKYLGDTFDYYNANNSFINCVLKRRCGLPIILSIIYESVARRMGLNCEPLNTPVHFLIRLQSDKGAHSVLFIDAFNAHTFSRLNEEGKMYSPEKIPKATTKQVLERMVVNVDKAWERNGLLNPMANIYNDSFPLPKILNRGRIIVSDYFAGRLQRLSLTTKYYRNTSEGTYFKDCLVDNEFNYRQYINTVPKSRPVGMLFAVGVIVIYKVFNEVRFYGVIVDWTPTWEESMDTMHEFRNTQQNFKTQPFYKILSENKDTRYLPQEYLSLVLHHYPQRFFKENYDLGRHFCRFEDGVFIPNYAKNREYCEDDIYRLIISKDVLQRMIRQALRQDERLAVGYRCQYIKKNGLLCRMPFVDPIFNIFCTCDEPQMN